MLRSATGIRPVRSARGFTLLELLVVVAIAGLLVALVALSLGGISGPRPEAELRVLADRIALAQDEATLTGRTLGLRAAAHGLEFLELRLEPDAREASWRSVAADRLFGPVDYPEPYALALEVDGARLGEPTPDAPPPVLLLPDGEVTPFVLTLTAPGATGARLRAGPDGRLSIESLR